MFPEANVCFCRRTFRADWEAFIASTPKGSSARVERESTSDAIPIISTASLPSDLPNRIAIVKLAKKAQSSRLKYVLALDQIQECEEALKISERWSPEHPAYKACVHNASIVRYYSALDELERLLVLRLFELHKANLAETGTLSLTHSPVHLLMLS